MDAAPPVAVGEMLAGKYRIDRVLGAGGMGVVVAATHVQLDQRVAIKFLLPQALANADVVARFAREARAAVKIQSEHVARVIDVGTLETGAPYMVMEYLEGTDLAHRIAAEGKLPLADAARCVLEACEALAEAHAAGIVHRDLKPANLFLAKRADKTSIVKVLDFGISKISTNGAASAGAMTSTQAVMGSPYYMSPEQLMSAKHVDARADVWSLGVVLYEALVGSPPYVADTMPEIVAQILQAPLPSVCAQRPDVPADIDRVLGKCLAKDAAARYPDVAALARELAPFATDGARSVERISRVLGSAEAPSAQPPARASVTDGRGGTVSMKSAATSQPSAWGATNVGIPKRSNAPLVAIAAALAVGVLGVVAFFAWKREPPRPAAQTGLVEAPAPPPSVSESAAPPVPPPPVASAEPAATTTASTVTSAHAAVRPPPHAPTKPAASAKPTVTPPPAPHNALDMGIK